MTTQPSMATSIDTATAVARQLADGQFDAALQHMSPDIRKSLSREQLAGLWHQLVQQFGPFAQFGQARVEMRSEIEFVILPAAFQNQTIELLISIRDGTVVGLFVPPNAVAVTKWQPPNYVDQTAFDSVDTSVGREPFKLGATLTLPNAPGRHPAVILVHGSGPGDRDESVGPNRPFRDLAEGLASRGVAVLRYDKRTKIYPAAVAALTNPTVQDETIDDVNAAVAVMVSRPDTDPARIIVVGHSLGATLAPRIAAGNSSIKAIVLLAAATRPLPDIMVEQIVYLNGLSNLPSAESEQSRREVESQAALARNAKPGDIGPAIFGAPPSYWADLNQYDPVMTAKDLRIPMLILQGTRDYQVTPSNLDRFRTQLAGHANVEIIELPGLNHLFMPGTGPGTPQEYAHPSHVDGQVVDLIADFISRLAAH